MNIDLIQILDNIKNLYKVYIHIIIKYNMIIMNKKYNIIIMNKILNKLYFVLKSLIHA